MPFPHFALPFALLFILFFLPMTSLHAQDTRPNIVVVLCDDLGYGDLENYGHPHIRTPHLNRMAEEGLRFTDFYAASPVCSPSRAGLLTGRLPNRAGIYDWIPEDSQVHLRASEVTIPALLKSAGYATFLGGKWHLNGRFDSPAQPQPGDFGFDHWFATQNNAAPSHENPVNFVRNGETAGPLEGYSCQLVVDEALDWLSGRQAEQPDQPFFMLVAFHEPHEPVASPPHLVERYLDVARNRKEAEYFANIANIDAATGKLMAGLERLGVDENTLVIFTSDNGPETLDRYPRADRSYGSPGPLRGMKLWTTEAGIRVPGILRWPAAVEGGTVSHEPVAFYDFLPTFAHLAGAGLPPDLALDGTDFRPALRGQPIEREQPLTWIFYRALNDRPLALRDGDWKALAGLETGPVKKLTNENVESFRTAGLTDFAIYDLADDLDESDNRADADPRKARELRQRLESRHREILEDSHVWGPGK